MSCFHWRLCSLECECFTMFLTCTKQIHVLVITLFILKTAFIFTEFSWSKTHLTLFFHHCNAISSVFLLFSCLFFNLLHMVWETMWHQLEMYCLLNCASLLNSSHPFIFLHPPLNIITMHTCTFFFRMSILASYLMPQPNWLYSQEFKSMYTS